MVSNAVDASAVARVVGIETNFEDRRAGGVILLPQRVALVGQGASAATYSTDKTRFTNADDVGKAYGFGSPVHLAARQLLPANGDGLGSVPLTVFPLEDAGGAVAASGDITPAGAPTVAASYIVRVNNIDSEEFVIAVGDNVAAITAKMTQAINAALNMPVIATDNGTDVGLAAKWAGSSSNDLVVEVIGSTTAGNTFGITQPTGGLVNPDVDVALNQIGDVWETMVVNCLEISDTTTLGKYATFGEGRWQPLVRKPLVVFTGNTEVDVNTAVTVPDSRKTDRVNAQLVAPGSNNLPFVVAARQVARIAVLANNNPPYDYGSQPATGLTPGADGDQWTYAERDLAVKAGSSTIEVKSGVINVSDVVTFYHPDGEAIPPFRFVVDIVKLQNIIFNLDLIFTAQEWDGAPLIPDDQATTNRAAKKPKSAVAAIAAMLDSLGLEAIISDPETAKANTFAEIDDQNPKRLNVTTSVQVSGNANIKSIDLNFGFFFGTSQVVA
jgi:phage tail sheath gpL-like